MKTYDFAPGPPIRSQPLRCLLSLRDNSHISAASNRVPISSLPPVLS
jgi:hypothetical protein